jgi:DNA polymerase III delta prime subunit
MSGINDNLKRPLFVGLPGAGKTTIATAIAQQLGMEIIGTDPLFRVFRAISSADFRDPRAEVMRNFLARASEQFPDLYPKLQTDAETADTKNRCALHDSVRFRAYGEDVFRLFEIEMLKWLDRHGDFKNKIVDLSASAPLYEENHKLFSPANGYLPILVDTPHDQICKNILKDYIAYREQSRIAGESKPIRGAYEKAIDDALGSTDPNTPEGKAIALKIVTEMTEKESRNRMEKYRAFASKNTLIPTSDKTLDKLVEAVLNLIH